MSIIDELISELCPNGIEYKTLGELGNFYGGITGKSKKDFVDGNASFITYKNVYSNPALDIFPAEKVRISEGENQKTLQYGDVIFTGSSEVPDECGISSVITEEVKEDLYLNSFCFFFRFDDLSKIDPAFMKHLFRSKNLRNQIGKTASGVTRYNVSKKLMAKVIIPIPPLRMQSEIVKLLDKYSELSSELIKKLINEYDLRKKQMDFYFNSLFANNNHAKWIELSSIADIGTGSSNTKDAVENGAYPFYVRSQEPLKKNEFEYDETAIITAGDGVGVGKVFHFVEGKYALHQRAYRIHINTSEVLPKYCYYYMKNAFYDYITLNMYQGSVASIRRPMLNKFKIPIVQIDEQLQIISKYDRLEHNFTSIIEELQNEINARKKQYEYYRDKLLDFKEHI